jgi:uncharacterized membrane protein
MKRKLILTMLLVGIGLVSVSAVQAQKKSNSTTLRGIVLGADGKPVPAAGVSCESSGGIRPRVVHTDAQGRFAITGLRNDNYDLRASANGAYSDWEKNISVKAGQTKEVTLRLLNGNTALSGILPAKKKQ